MLGTKVTPIIAPATYPTTACLPARAGRLLRMRDCDGEAKSGLGQYRFWTVRRGAGNRKTQATGTKPAWPTANLLLSLWAISHRVQGDLSTRSCLDKTPKGPPSKGIPGIKSYRCSLFGILQLLIGSWSNWRDVWWPLHFGPRIVDLGASLVDGC